MKKIDGTLYEKSKPIIIYDAIVLPTTINVEKKNVGEILLSAKDIEHLPERSMLSLVLSYNIHQFNFRCFVLHAAKPCIISFPVKRDFQSDISSMLVEKSCKELLDMCRFLKFKKILIGFNTKKSEERKMFEDLIEPYLDDRFILVSGCSS